MPKRRAKDRPKRPDSATLAKPRKVHVLHAGGTRVLLEAQLDRRTKLGKAYFQHVAALEAHVGGDLSPPQARLCDQAARLGLLAAMAWSELSQRGAFHDGEPTPAVDTYMRAIGQERQVLLLLGLERATKQITLQDVLNGKAEAADG